MNVWRHCFELVMSFSFVTAFIALRHLVQALLLNLKNGFLFVVLFFITLLLVCFPILIGMAILYPKETGLHEGKGNFLFGITYQR
jgi:uncharacterized membrane protein